MSKRVGPELLSIVNEQDVVQGCLPADQIHAQRLLHRTVAVIVQSKDRPGRVLVQTRSLDKSLFPGALTLSVTGHVQHGEGWIQAARRESVEEIGQLPSHFQRLTQVLVDDPTHLSLTTIYKGEAYGPFKTKPEEVASVDWRSTDWVRGNLGLFTPPSQVMLRETLLK